MNAAGPESNPMEQTPSQPSPSVSAPPSAPPASASPSAPPATPLRRRRRRRWLVILTLAAVVTIAASALVGQRFLESHYAHQWVLNRLQTFLGLRINARKITINWQGRTTLYGVDVGLPLGHWPFLHIAKLRFTHNIVPLFLLTGELRLRAIQIVAPRLIVRRSSQGGRNISLAWSAIRHAWEQWKTTHPGTRPLSATTFPVVTLTEGSLSEPAPTGRGLKITGITLAAHPQGPLTWRFRLATAMTARGGWLKARGVLVPGQDWFHSVQLSAAGIQTWLKAFWPQWRGGDVLMRTHLLGQYAKSVLHEKLTRARIRIGPVQLRGSATVAYTPTGWRISPQHLNVRMPWIRGPILLYRGQLWADDRGIHIQKLAAQAGGGEIHLTGLMNPAMGSAQAKASWHNVSLFGAELQSGSLNFHLASPWPSWRVLAADITTSGQTPYGSWNAQLQLSAQGSFRRGLNWQLAAPQLSWQHWRNINLSGLHAVGTFANEKIVVRRCTLASDPHSLLTGSYSLFLGLWHLHLRAPGNAIPLAALPPNVNFRLDAYGNWGGMDLENLTVKNPSWSLTASGNCIFINQYPAHLLLTVTGLPLVSPGATAKTAWSVGGLISGKLLATGTLLPVKLNINGQLAGTRLTVNNHPLLLPTVHVHGLLTRRHVQVAAIPLALLGGRITIAATARTSGRLATMNFAAQGLSAAQLATWLLPPQAQKFSGQVNLSVRVDVPNRDVHQAHVQGTIALDNIVPPPLPLGLVVSHIATASAKMIFDHGVLTLNPIVIQEAGSFIHATASWAQANPQNVQLQFTVAHWPLAIPSKNISISLSGQGQGSWPWLQPAAYGNADIRAHFLQTVVLPGKVKPARPAAKNVLPPRPPTTSSAIRTTRPATPAKKAPPAPPRTVVLRGHLTGHVTATGQRMAISHLRAAAMGNTFSGSVAYTWGHPLAAAAQLHYDVPHLAALLPGVQPLRLLHGDFAGTLALGPAAGPHPLAPLQLSMKIHARRARFAAMHIDDSQFTLFFTHHSAVLAKSTFALADGTIRPWAMFTRHSGAIYSAQANLRFQGVQLGQITQSVQPDRPPIPGLLAGRAVIIATPGRWRYAFGHGRIRITRSDLSDTAIIAAVDRPLTVMPIGAPTGRGAARWRVENGDAHITSLHYWNRGVYVLGTGVINNIWRMPESRIKGDVVGTVRPFRNFHIPFIPQARAVLDALQSNVSSVEVTGTWANPVTTPVAFKRFKSAIQEIFVRAVVGRAKASPAAP